MNKSKIFYFVIGTLIIILLASLFYTTFIINSKNNNQIFNVSDGINPPKGNINAKIKIIEFSDYECPACGLAEPRIDNILQDYPDDIILFYRNYPLPIHPDSELAAKAAQAANEQGKFWEYHNILFKNQDKLDKESLEKYAKNLGLNITKFNSDIISEKIKEMIQNDVNEAHDLRIEGTPTFFINGKKVLGFNQDKIIKIINEELKKIEKR